MIAGDNTTLPLVGNLFFTAGLRYEHINMKLNQNYIKTRVDTGDVLATSGYDTEGSWSALLPKGVLFWNIRENAMVYASVAKGYLAGGLNAYENEKDRAKFDEQTSIDYEIGAKTQWLNNRLSLDLTLFYMDIKDMHVYSMPEPSIFVASNAGEAHSKGIEVEARARPLEGFDVIARFGWVDAQYDDYQDYSGNKMQGTPDYTFNLTTQYRHTSGIFARGELLSEGKTYYNDNNTDSQNSYAIVNAKIGYEGSSWDLYVYGNNLFDKEYFSYGRSCGVGTLNEVGDPRTFGIIASMRF